ncbi:MAG: TldD/PmbA family protein [Polyangiaceae bacterium]
MPIVPGLDAVLQGIARTARERLGVQYAELRFVDSETERLRIRNGVPEFLGTRTERGVGVRVLHSGAWGFACTHRVDEGSLWSAVERAVEIGRESARILHAPVDFPPREAQRGRYQTPLTEDPFTVSLERKFADLESAERILRGNGAPVRASEAWMTWTRIAKLLFTSEGSELEQDFVYGDVGMLLVAVSSGGRSQRRSFPSVPGASGFQGGYERVAALELADRAHSLRSEALELLDASECPGGRRDVILATDQLALQIHESCGHPTELDRALGQEITLAGGSFLQPTQLGRLRYGSEIVTLNADSTTRGGMGTFGWDDEATPARCAPLVQEGLFVDYLSSRETSVAIGRESTATVRAESWNRLPMIRMVNVSLAPRSGSLEDLIADTKDGILFQSNQSWSIDDMRLNFQFSTELAWEIKQGKRTRLLRDARYTGITPEFWGSCDAICGPEEFELCGFSNCGKGDPVQIMHVGHGTAPARFRAVEVGHT